MKENAPDLIGDVDDEALRSPGMDNIIKHENCLFYLSFYIVLHTNYDFVSERNSACFNYSG